MVKKTFEFVNNINDESVLYNLLDEIEVFASRLGKNSPDNPAGYIISETVYLMPPSTVIKVISVPTGSKTELNLIVEEHANTSLPVELENIVKQYNLNPK